MARLTARSTRIRPLAAMRAIRALLRDPDDTSKVFDVIDALSGRSGERVFERFRKSENGARLLVERPDLVATLNDRARLLAMPAGTLGRVYGEFVTREQISADGLVAASVRDRDPTIPEERYWFGGRLRDMHDLWHVVTGYKRDLLGEAALLAFSYAQTGNRGVGFIVLVAYLKAGPLPHGRTMIGDGYRKGRTAAWLPEQDWEALLEKPLEEVRRELRVGPPTTYDEVRSAGAPALA